MDSITEKRCSKCGLIKSIDNFTTDRSTKDGKRSDCNKCRAVIAFAWKDKNIELVREREKEYAKKYQAGHPKERTINANTQRAKRKSADGKFTIKEWKELCNKYDNRCLCCGALDKKLTIDHVIPISKGGTNTIENIQPLCSSCNRIKYTKTVDYR